MRASLSLPALALAAAAALSGMAATPARANGPYSPVAFVNDRAVTEFELQQRRQFLTILNAPAEMIDGALDALIDDRLRFEAAKEMNITANPDEVKAAMENFAQRARLTSDEFTAELGKIGIQAETFRDFVTAGVIWGDVVRARFGNGLTISERDIEQAVDKIDNPEDVPPGARVLLSEIIVRRAPEEDARARTLVDRIAKITQTEADFDASARQYSTAASRTEGGKLDWMALDSLPPAVQGAVAALKPGQWTKPLHVQDGIYAMFLLHERKNAPQILAKGVDALEYAEYLIPGGRSSDTLAQAARITGRTETCEGLHAEARGKPAGTLTIQTQVSNRLPADVAGELARLDPGESSTALTRGGNLVLLMLCSRSKMLDDSTIPRKAVEARLRNDRLQQQAEAYMADLRAKAMIRYP